MTVTKNGDGFIDYGRIFKLTEVLKKFIHIIGFNPRAGPKIG